MNYEKAEDDQENDPVFARMLFKVRWQLFSPLDAGNRIDGQSWQERITYHLSIFILPFPNRAARATRSFRMGRTLPQSMGK